MTKINIEKELKETINVERINEYSHIIIWINRLKETYSIRLVSKTENVDLIKKEYEKCIILPVNELYTQTSEEKFNTSVRVQNAISYATKMHQNQYRHDGSAYISHPLRVANYVRKYKNSNNIEDLYIAAILHDVIEDSEATYCDIVKLFGIQVASLVLELTNDEDLLKELGKTKYLKIKMKNMSSWALVIKLCDRLDNTCDLMSSNEKFRNKYVKETIDIINYILENRSLSKTHINIISKIIDRLYFVSNTCKYEEYYESINSTESKVKRLTK